MATLYVQSGSNAINVIDTDLNLVVATIPVGAFVFRFNAVASRLYTISSGQYGVFAKIDTNTNTILGTNFGNELRDMVLNLYGTRAYIINNDSQSVLIVDTITLALLTLINLPRPDAIKLILSPDDSRLYVFYYAIKFMDVIDTITNTVIKTLTFNAYPSSIAYSSDATRVFITKAGFGGMIDVLDAQTLSPILTINCYGNPGSIEIRSNYAYVGTDIYTDIIDTIANVQVAALFPGGLNFVFSPDGSRLYAAYAVSNNGLSVFDLATHSLLTSHSGHVHDLVITREGSRIYYSDHATNRVTIVDSDLTDIGLINIDGVGGNLALKPIPMETNFEKIRSTGVLKSSSTNEVAIEFLNNDPSVVTRIQYYGYVIVTNELKTPFVGEVFTLEPFVETSRTFLVPEMFEIQIGIQFTADVLITFQYNGSTVIMDSELSPMTKLTLFN